MAEKGSSEVVDNEPIQCLVEGLFLAGITTRADFAHTKGRERHLLVVFLPPRLTTLFRRTRDIGEQAVAMGNSVSELTYDE